MDNAKVKRDARLRRHRRVRRRVVGTAERPRLAVFRSNKQIYAQLIDDRAGRTLAAAGSPTSKGDGDKKAAASRVGAELATKAKTAGITFTVESPTRFSVSGIDKQLVGETAANIRKLRKPDPYKGKGVRYAGEQVRRKAGKTAK